jgi:hypothetical protein
VAGDGHFTGFEPLICAEDAEVIETAKRLFEGEVIEVWSGHRLIARFEPQ